MPEAPFPKVLRIIDRLNIGGPAIHVVLLSKHWRTVLLIGKESEGEGNMLDLAEQEGVRPEQIPSLGRELHPVRDIATFLRIVRLIRRERPDIVHTHKSKAGALGRLAAWLCRVPVRVHTFHGHVLHGYFGPAKSRFFVLVERAMAGLSDRLIAVSPKVKEDLVGYGVAPEGKIDVLPLGLDLERFAAKKRGTGTLRAELGLGPGVPLVGIVARLVPIKDIPAFLEAGKAVLESVPDAHFAVAGDGELRQEVEAFARAQGLEGRVHFLGFRGRLEELLSDMDVLTLTSRNEGSPVSLIEGLAAGCAVAAMDVGGVRDVVLDGKTGVLTPAGDTTALAGAIVRLLKDPEERRRLSEAGRKDTLERYSIRRLVRDLDSLYRGLLQKKASRRPIAGELALLAVSLGLSFTLVEAAFRAWFPQPTYAVKYCPWGFEHIPNISFKHTPESKETVSTLTYNSEGFRSEREYSIPKPADMLRVAILGDSYAEGAEVDAQYLHATVLERLLNEHLRANPGRYRRAEVIDAGVYAYDSCQELRFFESRVQKYRPDLVFVIYTTELKQNWTFCRLDGDTLRYLDLEYSRNGYAGRYLIGWLKAKSHALNYLGRRLRRLVGKPIYLPGLLDQTFSYSPWTAQERASASSRMGRPIRAYAREALGRGGRRLPQDQDHRLLFAIFDRFDSGVRSAGGRMVIVLSHREAESSPLAHFAAQRGMEFLDLYSYLNDRKTRAITLPLDGHWDEYGHRLVGEGLFAWVRSESERL